MWIQLALFVASLIISNALAPKPEQPRPATAEDIDLPTIEDGTPKVVIFGDVWITSWCVIGSGNFRNDSIYKKQKGLFGSKKVKAGYKYFMSLHMGIAMALDDLVEIKVSDKTAWTGTISSENQSTISINQPNLFGGDESEGGIVGKLTIMRGAADQPALPELQEMFGIVPAYRGCVTFFYDGQISANSVYPKPWSFRVRRTTSGWDGGTWYPEKATIWLKENSIKAMNPAHIIYEAQTNRDWGRGFSASQLDVASFTAAANQLYNEGFGLCLAWRRQDTIQSFIQEILDHIGAAMQVDRMTGLWRLDLIRDNYDVSTITSFNFSTGLLRVEEDNNSSNDLVTNQTIISYVDPVTNETLPARAENLAAIQRNGIILENKTYTGIPTVDLAGRVAARNMKAAQSGLKRFKVVLDRRGYTLQPTSVFKLELPERGIESIVVRAVRVEHDSITNGEITVTAVQDVFGLPATNFIKDQPSLWQPPSLAPQIITAQTVYEVPFAELLQEFTVDQLQAMSDKAYIGVLAEQPGSLQLDFGIYSKLQSDSSFENFGSGDFSFSSEITEAIAVNATQFVCQLVKPISTNIAVGDRAFINAEIVRVESINLSANTLTLSRGCIDTVPTSHPSGSKIIFYSNLANVIDRQYATNQIVNCKLTSRTSQGELDLAQARAMNITVKQRLFRPYPPCNVMINGSYYPSTISGDLSLSWQHRNRLLQTGKVPSFVEAAQAPETNTGYNLTIYDALNAKIFEKTGLTSTNYVWSVPRIFDGEMVTVLNIPMTGANNTQSFSDTSVNGFTVQNNLGALIKTDAQATGGSSAFMGQALLATSSEHQKLDVYSEDHCIEMRIKTAAAGDYLGETPDILYFRIHHDKLVSENISTDYLISIQSYDNQIVIQVIGTVFNESASSSTKIITYTATGLVVDTYYDIAIQCINSGTTSVGGTDFTNGSITIFFAGTAVHTDTLHLLSWNYPCSLRMNLSPNYQLGSKISVNGLRITKRAGGRYSGNYIPQAFVVGSGDTYWSSVVLLIPMTGSNGAHNFMDVSLSPAGLSASDMVATQTNANANGGSAAYFFHPMLKVLPQTIFNLRDKSFIIEGRVKCGAGQLLQISSAMVLTVGQYSLTLSNFDSPTPQTVTVALTAGVGADWTDSTYFNFKIVRDASTGITTLWFNEKSASGQFNPTFIESPQILLGFPSAQGSYNGFKIQTADSTAELIPNVSNPLRVEIESTRDGLVSFQAFSAIVTVT